MLKTNTKRFIIKLTIALFMLVFINNIIISEDSLIDDFEIKPVYKFQNKGARDPFEPSRTFVVVRAVRSVVALSNGLSCEGNQLLAPSGGQSVNTKPLLA